MATSDYQALMGTYNRAENVGILRKALTLAMDASMAAAEQSQTPNVRTGLQGIHDAAGDLLVRLTLYTDDE